MRKLILLSGILLVGLPICAVNMPTGPIYTSTPSVGRSAESAYKKAPSDYKAPSRSVDNTYSGSAVSGVNAYCITPDEYRLKIDKYIDNDPVNDDSPSYSTENHIAYLDENIKYFQSLFPACINYFKSTSNPDCSRIETLHSGYIWLDDPKKPAARAQMKSLTNLKEKCKLGYEAYIENPD